MASFIAIIRYALLETFFCISILAKTIQTKTYTLSAKTYTLLRGGNADA